MEIQTEFVCIILPTAEWRQLKKKLEEIHKNVQAPPAVQPKPNTTNPYITAKEFMASVRICRSNFDKLVQKNKIKTLKKGRKWYVASGEVERYFNEVEV